MNEWMNELIKYIAQFAYLSYDFESTVATH